MTVKEAENILEVGRLDDAVKVKKKFRKLMIQYHPDAVGSDTPEYRKKAQQINEAYSILREKRAVKGDIPAKTDIWKGRIVEQAFTERSIYMILWEGYKTEYLQVTKGKYTWDPDLEEFDCLLKSLNEAALELLEIIECRNGIYSDEEFDIKTERFPYQVRLFHLLAGQYISPSYCLKKLAVPVKNDENKRNSYKVRAFLGEKGRSRAFRTMSGLTAGDPLYIDTLENNRIMVSDGKGVPLGYLSLAENQMYYVVIPILRKHLAQAKLSVSDVEVRKSSRPYRVRVNIDIYLQVENMEEQENVSEYNTEINTILDKYDIYLKEIGRTN
ncbi:hypothetical protein C0033_05540 [Clostridium sp. chh4-2]|uniref:J domain-containing protein n=1 Tax=Clostridium sp. chh4-2 TaxID=2067550 RepID=UPI000CCE2E0B|nr:J domain-containing protein [Clostridium sp. chh4-2]PNV62993.1 hypothetical protein C0033_05540 [Clostridium sp. chh4-2]